MSCRRTAHQALYLIDKIRPHYKDLHDNIDFEVVSAAYNNGLQERGTSLPHLGPRDKNSLKDQLALMRKACRAVSEHGRATGGGSEYYALTEAGRKEYLNGFGGQDLGTASSWYDSAVHVEFRQLIGDKAYKVQEVRTRHSRRCPFMCRVHVFKYLSCVTCQCTTSS